MVALADTALDFCVLELGLLLGLVTLVLAARLPVADGPEGNVLGNRDCVCLGAGGLALFLAKLGPLLALGDAGVDNLLDDRLLDAARRLVLFAVFADAVGNYRLGAILIPGGLWGRESGDVVLVVFLCPVGAAI